MVLGEEYPTGTPNNIIVHSDNNSEIFFQHHPLFFSDKDPIFSPSDPGHLSEKTGSDLHFIKTWKLFPP